MRHLLFGTWLRLCLCGSHVPLSVGEETFYLDLLFDQVRRHCYFVIKLMVGKFKTEYAGLDRVMLPGIVYQQDAVIRMEAADELCLSQVKASEVYRSHTCDALRCLYTHHMRGGPAAPWFRYRPRPACALPRWSAQSSPLCSCSCRPRLPCARPPAWSSYRPRQRRPASRSAHATKIIFYRLPLVQLPSAV